ncbi:MAG: type II toxin-antitoxin system RelE/ParE family toxin [Tannerellaceae bacterium]|nr:type II toxin-antitoxin system RelE/ParE family toxin [Tannerellaceae bacterium]
MRKIIWLPYAVEDMDAIYQFYIDKNPTAAISIYNNLLQEVNILIRHPKLGKVETFIDGSDITFRSLIAISGRYKIIYYIYEDNIYISQIWDCRRNPDSMRKM